RWTGDAVQFRFLITTAASMTTMVMRKRNCTASPVQRLAAARARIKEAKAMSLLAHDVRGYVEEIETYDPHVAVSTELVDWQAYVMAQLEHSTAILVAIEPKTVESKGPFQVLEIELTARGSSYREFVDFIARIEHGERLMRIEKMRLEKHQTSMYLTCMIKGIVKSTAVKAKVEVTYGPPWLDPSGKPHVVPAPVAPGGGEAAAEDEDAAGDAIADAAGAADAGDAERVAHARESGGTGSAPDGAEQGDDP
ncbi:MAG TPA: hypothetical protein VK824_11785, partial [Planctomycetota bacterium]|nr:hypothetical protein [Planctomycetota bacterium]